MALFVRACKRGLRIASLAALVLFPVISLAASPQASKEKRPSQGSGTAFVISSDGYLLTCQHVLQDAQKIYVKVGGKVYDATIVTADEKRDLAVLRIRADGLPTLSLGDSDQVEKGQELRAFGYPLLERRDDPVTVTRGTLANIFNKEGQKLLMLDVVLNPGNSGGPLVNERGEVVGVNVQKARREPASENDKRITNVGIAANINDAKKLMRDKFLPFSTEGGGDKLDGPALVRRVAPSVAWVVVTRKPDAIAGASPTSSSLPEQPGTFLLPDPPGLLRTLKGHTDEVKAVAFSPDGKTLASGSPDSTVRLWDVQSGVVLHTLKGHGNRVNAVAFAPDGQTLASAGDDKLIKLWSPQTGAELRSVSGHKLWIYSLAFSPDGKTLASGSYGEIKLWDMNSYTLKKSLAGQGSLVYALAFSPDGFTVVGGYADKVVRIWDVRAGTVQATLEGHDDEVIALASTADGKTLATGSRNGTLLIWDMRAGKTLRTLRGEKSQGWLSAIAFSPSGKTLAEGSGDGGVRLWDVDSGTLQRTLSGHNEGVNAVAFSPDGKMLATGAADRTIKIWRFK